MVSFLQSFKWGVRSSMLKGPSLQLTHLNLSWCMMSRNTRLRGLAANFSRQFGQLSSERGWLSHLLMQEVSKILSQWRHVLQASVCGYWQHMPQNKFSMTQFSLPKAPQTELTSSFQSISSFFKCKSTLALILSINFFVLTRVSTSVNVLVWSSLVSCYLQRLFVSPTFLMVSICSLIFIDSILAPLYNKNFFSYR